MAQKNLLSTLRQSVLRSPAGPVLRSVLRRPTTSAFPSLPPIGDHLGELFDRCEIKLIDIGARDISGEASRNVTTLAPYSHYFAFEPDARQTQQIEDRLREQLDWKRVTVIPKAVGSSVEPGTLRLTRQPGLSSLLEPDPSVAAQYALSNEFEVMDSVPTATRPLGEFAKEFEFEDATFLKVDTQGTELDILQSGREVLEKSIVGVYVEVEFQRFYKGQPLFNDVDSFLSSLGFTLFDLDRTLTRRTSRWNEHFSRRQVIWAHALYLKEPAYLASTNSTSDTTTDLGRLLAVALAFQHFDVALQILQIDSFSEATKDHAQLKRSVRSYVMESTNAITSHARVAATRHFKDRDNSFV